MRRACLFPLLVAGALLGQCHCGQRPESDAGGPDGGSTDTGYDGEAEGDAEADGDADRQDADPDLDESDEPDVEERELCLDAPPAWTWHPYECPEYEQPDDCCASCRLLTCREGANHWDIWGDRVAYVAHGSVGIVDLTNGQDRIVLHKHFEGGRGYNFHNAVISSRYIVARKNDRSDPSNSRLPIVARSLSDLDGPEITLDESEGMRQVFLLDAYEEWVLVVREPYSASRDFEMVLYNIETGERRIIARGTDDYGFSMPGMWGDRVVWGGHISASGKLQEYRISTGETRDVIDDPDLFPMYTTSVWENWATFNHQPEGDWDVVLVNLDTGEVRRVLPTSGSQEQGSIHGGRVIVNSGMSIHVYSIRSDRSYELHPSGTAGSEPMIFDRNVVWNGRTAEGLTGIWVTQIGDI